jgi:exosortase A-associated hydrolase 1
VLIVVGGPQYRVGSHRQFLLLARAIAAAGVPAMRFDYRGMGDSAGQFLGFEHIQEDLEAAIQAFMAGSDGLRDVVLWGLCDGGTAAIMYGSSLPAVRGLIVVNPWVHTVAAQAKAYLRHYYVQRLFSLSFWRKAVSGEFNPGRSLRELMQSVGSLVSVRTAQGVSSSTSAPPGATFIDKALEGLKRFKGPIMLVISERDFTAKEFLDLCDDSADWKASIARADVTTRLIAGADHTFSERSVLEHISGQCIAWLSANFAAGAR